MHQLKLFKKINLNNKVSFFLLFGMLLSCNLLSNKKDKILEEAFILDSLNRNDEAKIKYLEVLGLESSNKRALARLGVIEFEEGNLEKSIGYLSDLLRLDSLNIYGYGYRGMTFLLAEENYHALEDFKKAIELKDYQIRKDAMDTESFFDMEMEKLIFGRGLAYFYLDSLDRAYEDFTFCIYNNYNVDESRLYRAYVLLKMNKLVAACIELNSIYSEDFSAEKDSLIMIYCANGGGNG